MSLGEHPRGTTSATRLARLGFSDVVRAAETLLSVGIDVGADRDHGRDPGRVGDPGRDPGRDPVRDPHPGRDRDPGRDLGRDLGRDPGRDTDRVEGLAQAADTDLVEGLAQAADPDLALLTLCRLCELDPRLLPELRAHEGLRLRLTAVLGASQALGEHLLRHPQDWRCLADDDVVATRPTTAGLAHQLLEAVGAPMPGGLAQGATGPGSVVPGVPLASVTGADALDALRRTYRRLQLSLAARDLAGGLAVEDVAGELADLASAALQACLSVAAAELPAGSAPARLAVVAMGKCGGRELNYISDVDVVFVGEAVGPDDDERAALTTATRLAEGIIRVAGTLTSEGVLFPVDAGLRPEGRSGPLVRTLASHVAYYQKWARTWEFQALLKARHVAGDAELGRAYVEAMAPMVWSAGERDGFVADVQAMRRRVEESVPKREADRQIKLGRGGLRDVEFAVQLLQLVHGRADERLRSPTTLSALAALAEGGYVGREDAEHLASSYRFLRTTEHRLQLQRLRRTHVIPTDERDLRWLARGLGHRGDAVTAFEKQRVRHAIEVRRLHEKLFYRPLLDSVARLPASEVRLGLVQAARRLEALGFQDTKGALHHIEALTSGVSRRAAIQRTLLPVMLGWFAQAPDPDAGLLHFRQVSDALGDTPWYLRTLRDEGAVAERLARLLATSRYVADLLLRAPEAMTMLGDDGDLVPRSAAETSAQLLALASRSDTWEHAVGSVRSGRRLELLRVACSDLLGQLDVNAVGRALTVVSAATLQAALAVAERKVSAELRHELPMRLGVVGMGRLGGGEMGYASDADVLFVFEPTGAADEQLATQAAHAVAEELRRLLALPAPDPPLPVDAGLRPEGKHGPLVRSLSSYSRYYDRWSLPWEAQALLRAAHVAGDAEVTTRFLQRIDEVRWSAGFGPEQAREVRRLKARMEAERLPRGADRAMHLKLGPGGLSDVEWTVQLLQLQHAHELAGLRTTSTLDALRAATDAGLLEPADAVVLAEAWTWASRLRNALMLVTGKPSDVLPSAVTHRALAGVARVVGYPAADHAQLVEDHRRRARHARAVVDRVFYG